VKDGSSGDRYDRVAGLAVEHSVFRAPCLAHSALRTDESFGPANSLEEVPA
jgi:hypothetical protein